MEKEGSDAKKRPISDDADAANNDAQQQQQQQQQRKKKKQQQQNDKPVGSGSRATKENTSLIDKAYRAQFGYLGLEELGVKDDIGDTRVRNHVNPLAAIYQNPLQGPDWSTIYENADLPLFIDVGCASGRFGVQMAIHEKWSKYNHLGLEIRHPLVTRANAWAEKKELKNLHYVACSVNANLENLISTYPGPVSHIAVQFPDPHFKRKHHKRRVVQDEFLNSVARILKPGATLFLQSDVEEASAQMRDRTARCGYFDRQGEYTPRDSLLDPGVCADGSDDDLWTRDGHRARFDEKNDANEKKEDDETTKPQDYGDWLIGENPIGVPTEREVQNQALKLPIYRSIFVRNEKQV